jgi:hypothetical protein
MAIVVTIAILHLRSLSVPAGTLLNRSCSKITECQAIRQGNGSKRRQDVILLHTNAAA